MPTEQAVRAAPRPPPRRPVRVCSGLRTSSSIASRPMLARGLSVSPRSRARRVVEIDDARHAPHFGRQRLEQLEPLRRQLAARAREPGDVAAGPRQARDQAASDRVGHRRRHDRDRRRRSRLRGKRRRRAARQDHVDLLLHQLAASGGEALGASLGRAVERSRGSAPRRSRAPSGPCAARPMFSLLARSGAVSSMPTRYTRRACPVRARRTARAHSSAQAGCGGRSWRPALVCAVCAVVAGAVQMPENA